jgi:hypothetical protein
MGLWRPDGGWLFIVPWEVRATCLPPKKKVTFSTNLEIYYVNRILVSICRRNLEVTQRYYRTKNQYSFR